jgi:alpha-beta hydrolase superfamily lysophospholipase
MLAELVMASGLGYLASAYTASRWLTKPTPRRLAKTPLDYDLFYENVDCVTRDGERLAGWVVNPPHPVATLILCHGVRHNREQLLGRIALFASHGYRCVAFDHRAHGESTGKRTTFGYLESRDIVAILELVGQRWPDQPRAALGVSMGAAALCYAAECTRHLHALVLESAYHDIRSAFFTRMAAYPSYIRTLGQAILWVTERRLGLRLAQLSPVEYVSALGSAPVLLLTGAQDQHATAEDTYRLYERCRGPREILVIPNAAHGDVFETGGSLYEGRVLGFLQRHTC